MTYQQHQQACSKRIQRAGVAYLDLAGTAILCGGYLAANIINYVKAGPAGRFVDEQYPPHTLLKRRQMGASWGAVPVGAAVRHRRLAGRCPA